MYFIVFETIQQIENRKYIPENFEKGLKFV